MYLHTLSLIFIEVYECKSALHATLCGPGKHDFNSSAFSIIYLAYIRFIGHVEDYFLKWCINKMAAGSYNSIVKTSNFSDINCHYYVISGLNLR